MLWFGQDITATAHCMQQPRLALGFGFLAQVTHINLNDVALAAKVVVPDAIKDQIAGQDLAWIAHEQFEQFILFSRQVNWTLRTQRTMSSSVQFEIANVQDFGPRCRQSAPAKSTDT